MTNAAVPLRSTEEVARTIGNNIQAALKERGHDLTWLAGEIGIDPHTILRHFGSEVPSWLILEASYYLEVAPDSLVEAR